MDGEGDRLTARRKSDREVIEVRVLEIEESESEAVIHADNLHRNELSAKGWLEAISAWAAH